MAKVLKQVVNQYGVGSVDHVPVRCILQWFDDETNEEGQDLIDFDDMTAPQKTIFNNYKTMVEKFMGEGDTLQQVVNQYVVGRVPVRAIIQWVDNATGEDFQTIENRDEMGNPDKQVFNTYEIQCNSLMV